MEHQKRQKPSTGRQRGQRVAFVSLANPHIELKAPPNPTPPLCCHLDSIGFSTAGKSNASFKTNCFLLDQFFLSLTSKQCHAFMDTHSTRWTPSKQWHKECRRAKRLAGQTSLYRRQLQKLIVSSSATHRLCIYFNYQLISFNL